jgi:hypothetical protein
MSGEASVSDQPETNSVVIRISGYQVVDIRTSGHQVQELPAFCFPDILIPDILHPDSLVA